MYQLTKLVNELGFESVEAFEKYQKLMNAGASGKPQRPNGFVPIQGVPGQLTKPQRPDWYNPPQGVPGQLTKPQRPDWYEGPKSIDADAISNKISKATEDFETTLSELGSLDFKALETSSSSLKDYVKPLEKELEKIRSIEKERISLNIDTSDAKNQLDALADSYEAFIKACKTNNLNDLKSLLLLDGPISSSSGNRQYPPAPPINKGTGSSNKGGKPPKPYTLGFGFGGFKNEIDSLIEYAKKAGRKIKEAFSGPDEFAITIDDDDANGFNKTLEGLTNTFEK